MENQNNINKEKVYSSFRDPSGFLFWENNCLFREVDFVYKEHYDYLISSGLFALLVEKKLLVMHKEIDLGEKNLHGAYKVIQPEFVPFISYPYEWCFSQIKDAALITLQIQKYALEFGMTLKDASLYNVQFLKGKPIFIDTLSFEIYKDGEPWVAYRQFCQHFLAPLALMSKCNVNLSKMLQIYIDGLPLDLAKSILGCRSFSSFSLYMHINFQARMQNLVNRQHEKYKLREQKLSKKNFFVLIDNLFSCINSLKWNPGNTEWADYYVQTNYSNESLQYKNKIIESFLRKIDPRSLWDLGANTGLFSRIASNKGIETISFDIDPSAVEKNYLEVKKNKQENILPLLLDLTNPSPAIGWANKERDSLQSRGPADVLLALALIHHLVITANIPFSNVAEFFGSLGKFLIIEFVPKEDSQLQKMLLASRKNFPYYTREEFEIAFKKYFSILEAIPVKESQRIIYLMKKI